MTRLFNRTYTLTIDTLEVSGLSLTFKVEKSTRREPNTCKLSVWNLNANNRARLTELGRGTRIKLEAGYADNVHTLFIGSARTIKVRSEPPDHILDIEARDQGDTFLRTRISRSYNPGTEVRTVLRDLVGALGIGTGNLSELENIGLEGAGQTFPDGTTVDGQAYRQLDGIIRSMGLRWSVQNGVLQLQRRRSPLSSQAVLLTPQTGLIGSPSLDTARRRTAILSARAFLIPELTPGRKIDLRSSLYSGGYEIRRVVYSGASRGADWYADLTLRPF